MKNCKFIIQYGEKVDIEGYWGDGQDMPRFLYIEDGPPLINLPLLFCRSSLKKALARSDLDKYDAVFLSKPASPYRKHRQDGTEFIWGDNGYRVVEYRDGRIYHTWHGSNANIPDKYLTDRWKPVIELNKTKTISPKSYRNLLPKGLLGLIDMVEYVESVSDKPLNEMLVCEIGTYQGAAAGVFASAFRFLYTVDPWMRRGVEMVNVKAVYRENMINHMNYIHYQESGMDAVKRFEDGFLDLVYIDADHSFDAVVADINAWLPKLKPDGFLCGHDFPGRRGEVREALTETVGLPDKTFADNSWVIQYKKGVRV